jgi:hypothetical protein
MEAHANMYNNGMKNDVLFASRMEKHKKDKSKKEGNGWENA